MNKLKVGFLVNNFNHVDQSTFEILNKLKQKSHIFYKPIIIYGYTSNSNFSISFFKKIKYIFSYSKFRIFISKILYLSFKQIVKSIELVLVKKIFKDFGKIHDLSDFDYRKIELEGICSNSKLVFSIPKKDIKLLAKENFDILIKSGPGIFKGDILRVAKFGMLSFHYGDNRVNFPDTCGFFEALNKDISVGFIIQKINEELNGGDVIFRGNLTSHKLWYMNMAIVFKKSSIFMVKVLEEIYKQKKLPNHLPLSIYEREYHTLSDKPYVVLIYIIKILLPFLVKHFKGKILGFPLNRWSIAYSNTANGLKNPEKFKEIKNPKGRFLADPFTISSNNRKIIFVEDYFFDDNKGRISAIDITNNKDEFLGIVLEEEFHLSFPFVFKNENKIYMVPECSNSNQIRLYECIEFPLRWEFKCTLMDNVSAVDTILIKKEDNWFMLTNICSANINRHSSELHIFYSEKLFSNEWFPIKEINPVIIDSRQARNGGIFFDKDNIYRVNQVQTPETYGYSLKINLIKKLDKYKYEEETIDEIKPFFKRDLAGTHHFHSYGDISVIDFHRKILHKNIFK